MRFIKLLSAILLLLLIIVVGFYFKAKFFLLPSMEAPRNESAFRGYRELKIKDRVFKLEVADSEAKRTSGLSGRDSLPADQGMLFVFEKSARYGFWMKDMKFPIDIIWFNRGRVVYIVENAPPDNSYQPAVYNPTFDADSALELRAGEVRRLGIKTGDILSWE